MSYCVNCGVELDKSEPRCPLCGTEVVNPAILPEEKPARPYPSHVEHLDRRIDRRYIASFVSLLLLLTNIMANGALTWSYYVLGGELIAFTVLLLPMIAHMARILYIVIDAGAVGVLLLLIQVMNQGDWDWLLLLGLPVVGLAALFAWFAAWMASPKCRLPLLIRLTFTLVAVGLLAVGIEFFIGLYRHAISWPQWSLYVLFPCLVLGSALLLLNRRAQLKAEIRKRFYF
jgi:hypothetical protein